VNGTQVCRFAQSKDGTKPILPSILEALLAARKATESQGDPFMANFLGKRQLGSKNDYCQAVPTRSTVKKNEQYAEVGRCGAFRQQPACDM
jgi:hypothetical protein